MGGKLPGKPKQAIEDSAMKLSPWPNFRLLLFLCFLTIHFIFENYSNLLSKQ
jgi:hypothetical protein